MKKRVLFTGALALVALVAVSGCNKEETAIVDGDVAGYCLAGPDTYRVGSDEDANAIASWGYSDKGVMKAAKMSEVTALDSSIGDILSKRSVKGLYILENVYAGYHTAGWNSLGYSGSDLVMADGSLCIKVIDYSLDDETKTNIAGTWYTSAECHGESLTPSTLWAPSHSDVADDNGLDHNANPLILSGAGVYTLVFAKYSAAYEGSYCGIGVIQKSANKEGAQVSKVVPVGVESVGVIGGFADNSWASDYASLTNSDGTWTGSFTTASEVSFKVRLNGGWDYSYGYANLAATQDLTIVSDDDGNIKVAAGTYNVSITLPTKVSPASSACTNFVITKAE